MLWHRLQRYRWGISARHAQSTGVMYRGIMGLGHFSFFFFCSGKRRSNMEDLAAVTEDFRRIVVDFLS